MSADGTTAPGGPAPDGVGLDTVLAEIDEEVRRRRREIPAAEERELDALFLEHAPMGSRFRDLGAALRRVDAATFIDPVVPVDSQLPAGTAVKKGLRSLSMWYMGFVTHQVSQFASAVSRSLHMVDAALEDIRRRLPPPAPVPVLDAGEEGAWWSSHALDALAATRGRVLHAACGDGWLVRSLRAAGLDAYGVDPRPGMVDAPELEGTDLREEEPTAHLEAVGSGALAGVVLSGVVDGMALPSRRALVELLGERTGERATVVVHSLTPSAWDADDAPVEVDLAPGRPVRAAAWARQFEGWEVAVHPGPDGRDYLVVASR